MIVGTTATRARASCKDALSKIGILSKAVESIDTMPDRNSA